MSSTQRCTAVLIGTCSLVHFNGSCPGPTIQVNQGDRVRLILENHLPESTAIHWHGLEIPYAMDGMPYSQKPIAPGSRFAYEFTVHQNGTFFYHSHSPMQQMMGMVGLFILHPQQAHTPAVDHDFGVVLQEWAVLPNKHSTEHRQHGLELADIKWCREPHDHPANLCDSAVGCALEWSTLAWITTPSICTVIPLL